MTSPLKLAKLDPNPKGGAPSFPLTVSLGFPLTVSLGFPLTVPLGFPLTVSLGFPLTVPLGFPLIIPLDFWGAWREGVHITYSCENNEKQQTAFGNDT